MASVFCAIFQDKPFSSEKCSSIDILYDLTLIETFEENEIISALDFDNKDEKLAIFFARTLVVAHVVSRS